MGDILSLRVSYQVLIEEHKEASEDDIMPRPRRPGLYLYKRDPSQKRKSPDAELPEAKKVKYNGVVGQLKEEEESMTEPETEGSVTEPETDPQTGSETEPETDAELSQMVTPLYVMFYNTYY